MVLRLDRDGGRHLIVQVMGQRSWSEAPTLHDRLTAQGQAATIWWTPEGGAPRVVAGAPTAYPATVFEQVHPAMGDRVRRFAVDQLGPLEQQHVWDLYAGIGETSEMLTAGGASVESVEVDARAVAAAERRPGGPADRVSATWVARNTWSIGCGDPTGHHQSASHRNGCPGGRCDSRVATATEWSTSPATRPPWLATWPVAASSAARLRPTASSARRRAPSAFPPYRLTALRAFDLFPQTAHVETVAVLESV